MSRWSLGRTKIERSPSPTDDRVAAVATMYDEHVSEVYRFVHRRCQDRSLAEDITQETFVRALRADLDPSSVTIGWLLTVARNQMIDVLRRQASYDGKLRLVGAELSDGDTVDLVERLRIEAALNELSVDHRLVLTLHYIDGWTVPALADHLGRSAKSVEGLITRARRHLRTELEATADVLDGGVGHG